MLVRMLVDNGGEWPSIGGTIDLPDTLALELIEHGEATRPDEPQVETATVDAAVDTAVRKPARPRKAKA